MPDQLSYHDELDKGRERRSNFLVIFSSFSDLIYPLADWSLLVPMSELTIQGKTGNTQTTSRILPGIIFGG